MNVFLIIFIGIIICDFIIFGALLLALKNKKIMTDEEFAELKDYMKDYEQRYSSCWWKRNATFPFN